MKFTISITSSKVDRCISPERPPRKELNIISPTAKTENNIYAFLSFESLDDFPLLSWPFSKPIAYPFIAERLKQRLNNHYSHLFNKRGGWNKRGGGAKVAKSLNVELGINEEGGILGKN